jgi:hypothetical protein
MLRLFYLPIVVGRAALGFGFGRRMTFLGFGFVLPLLPSLALFRPINYNHILMNVWGLS